jgi:hypothetical protein
VPFEPFVGGAVDDGAGGVLVSFSPPFGDADADGVADDNT